MAAYITYTPDVQTESNAGNLFDEIRHHISDVFFLIHYFSQVSGLNCNLWNEENQSQVCFSNIYGRRKRCITLYIVLPIIVICITCFFMISKYPICFNLSDSWRDFYVWSFPNYISILGVKALLSDFVRLGAVFYKPLKTNMADI